MGLAHSVVTKQRYIEMKYVLVIFALIIASCSSKQAETSQPAETAAVVEIQPDADINNKDLVLLSREIAKSSDNHFGKKTKGFCGKTAEEMQQLLRAIQAKMDQQKIASEEVDKVLAENKKCGKACAKALCASKTFKKLDSEKGNYGSTSDGV